MTYFDKQLREIAKKDNILKDEPMPKHTSLKIGGSADYFIIVETVDELKLLIKFAKKNKIPITVVGNGTNLLVRDGGIRGFTIKLGFKDFKIRKTTDDVIITVDAGMSLSALSAIALKEELTGLEFLSGIPGTIGGALRMNAGAYGKEMKDIVIKTKYLDENEKIKNLNLKEHKFKYRNSIFSTINAIILDTTLRVQKGKKQDIEEKIKEYSESRKKTQPLEYPNAGSTFKRIEGTPTAKLIDDCGLKGYSIGGAEVSNKHAGFIINKEKATAKDVLELSKYVKEQVKKKFNKDIELEILVLGEE